MGTTTNLDLCLTRLFMTYYVVRSTTVDKNFHNNSNFICIFNFWAFGSQRSVVVKEEDFA